MIPVFLKHSVSLLLTLSSQPGYGGNKKLSQCTVLPGKTKLSLEGRFNLALFGYVSGLEPFVHFYSDNADLDPLERSAKVATPDRSEG